MAKLVVMDKYKVSVTQEPDGTFLAVCPEVQGVYAEGKTYLDAVLNVEDVLRVVLELKGLQQRAMKRRQSFEIEIPNPLVLGVTA